MDARDTWQGPSATGLALALLYVACSGWWLVEIAALSMIAMLVPLWVALRWPQARAELYYAVIVLSALVAHAPAPLRHWSPFERWRTPHGHRGPRTSRKVTAFAAPSPAPRHAEPVCHMALVHA